VSRVFFYSLRRADARPAAPRAEINLPDSPFGAEEAEFEAMLDEAEAAADKARKNGETEEALCVAVLTAALTR
jgi:hypothetical protein